MQSWPIHEANAHVAELVMQCCENRVEGRLFLYVLGLREIQCGMEQQEEESQP
jgi:hypothetical protein